MSEVPYVSATAALQAAKWERLFQQLPPEAGVLFVSVQPRHALSGRAHDFDVLIGISKQWDDGLGVALTKHVIGEEFEDFGFHIQVARGVPCAAAGAGAGADPHQSHDRG